MNIIFTCGGTGGHIYPAIYLYNEFKNHDSQGENKYLFVGSDYGLERDIFNNEQVESAEFICSRGIKRSIAIENIKSVFLNIKAMSQASKIFKSFKPDLVIGTGAYPSFHITYLAQKTKTPYYLIESNAKPGLVTKLFYKQAVCVFASTSVINKYLVDSSNIMYCGIPTRPIKIDKTKKQIINELGFTSKNPIVTVIGGSCGSEFINSAVIDMINNKEFYGQMVWATGKKDYDYSLRRLDNIPPNIKVLDYIDNMSEILSVTDLIVSRAGAMTIQEIKEFKIPAILVPFSKSAENHQFANATELKSMNVADIIEEKDINGISLKRAIDGILLDEKRRSDIHKAYAAMDNTNVNERIYNEVMCTGGIS